MCRFALSMFLALILFCVADELQAQDSPSHVAQDASPRTVRMIPVATGVQLEVLDWGGTGRPLVLLTGLKDNAGVYDKFARKLTGNYHVYGISRRGFGPSSAPQPDATNYSTARLGEDVIAVIDALHLNKPVVAGHSIAGEELSYIGAHHPERVAGLIYLDAGYSYALYDETNGDLRMDAEELRDKIVQFLENSPSDPADPLKYLDDLKASVQRVEKEFEQARQDMERMPPQTSGGKVPPIKWAILSGQERFTTFAAPALVIFAVPHDFGSEFKDDPKAREAMQAMDTRDTERQAEAFERQVPSAHVVRIPNADHYVFLSNEADVIREINTFVNALPKK
jgi:non-heme chloroperoxidase